MFLNYAIFLNARDCAYDISGEDYDKVIRDGAADTLYMECVSVKDGEGKNNTSELNPGESATVSAAWIVNEPDLADLYLNLDTGGSTYEFSENLADNKIVDIS